MTITITPGAAAGSTGVPSAILQADSRDDSGQVFIGTGTPTTTGVLATIAWTGNYSAITVDEVNPPKLVASFGYPSASLAATVCFVSSVTTNSFVVSATNAPPFNIPSASGIAVTWHFDP